MLKMLEKAGPTTPEGPSNIFSFFYMGSISIQEHEMGILENLEDGTSIYPKNTKSNFRNIGSQYLSKT